MSSMVGKGFDHDMTIMGYIMCKVMSMLLVDAIDRLGRIKNMGSIALAIDLLGLAIN